MSVPLLAIEGLTKSYPGVVANDDVSFAIGEGEVHALLGENGAGKSTLVKAIYGLIRPDSGRMLWRGQPYAPSAPHEARASGVAMVFQHFSLFDALDVAENVALGMDNPPPIRQLAARIRKVSGDYGLPLDPGRLVGDLSAGERQRVEIIRCLLQDPQLLIMDEPTSVLTPQEVEILFRTLRQLRAEGRSILYISHKLEEIRALCEQATVLRLGKLVGSCDPRERSARELAEMMVGTSLHQPERPAHQPGEVLLEVTGLNLASGAAFGTRLKDVGLEVRAGEILGIGGVAGNGQDELIESIAGLRKPAEGTIEICDRPLGATPADNRASGLAYVPADRGGVGLSLQSGIWENMTVGHLPKFTRGPFLSIWDARAKASDLIKRYDVRGATLDKAAGSLSGGNQQKVQIARELSREEASLIIAEQPSQGVDIGAIESIHRILVEMRDAGKAVFVISADLDEIFSISDRILVIYRGQIVADLKASDTTQEEVGRYMGGLETPASDVDASAKEPARVG